MSTTTPTSPILARVHERLGELLLPLGEELAEIEERLAKLDAERAELVGAKREIEVTLNRIDPSRRQEIASKKAQAKAKAKAKVSGNLTRSEETYAHNREAVLAFLDAHAGEMSEEGFTRSILKERLKEVNGTSMGTEQMNRVIDGLRESGVVRLDKKIRGGGHLYKLVATPNGGGK